MFKKIMGEWITVLYVIIVGYYMYQFANENDIVDAMLVTLSICFLTFVVAVVGESSSEKISDSLLKGSVVIFLLAILMPILILGTLFINLTTNNDIVKSFKYVNTYMVKEISSTKDGFIVTYKVNKRLKTKIIDSIPDCSKYIITKKIVEYKIPILNTGIYLPIPLDRSIEYKVECSI
jgi:hypothetical protein